MLVVARGREEKRGRREGLGTGCRPDCSSSSFVSSFHSRFALWEEAEMKKMKVMEASSLFFGRYSDAKTALCPLHHNQLSSLFLRLCRPQRRHVLKLPLARFHFFFFFFYWRNFLLPFRISSFAFGSSEKSQEREQLICSANTKMSSSSDSKNWGLCFHEKHFRTSSLFLLVPDNHEEEEGQKSFLFRGSPQPSADGAQLEKKFFNNNSSAAASFFFFSSKVVVRPLRIPNGRRIFFRVLQQHSSVCKKRTNSAEARALFRSFGLSVLWSVCVAFVPWKCVRMTPPTHEMMMKKKDC